MPSLNNMETIYQTLQTIYNIVKKDTDPTTYPCTYRDIILNSTSDSATIQRDLEALVSQNLLVIKKLDSTVFCITKLGIEHMNAFKNIQQFNTASPE